MRLHKRWLVVLMWVAVPAMASETSPVRLGGDLVYLISPGYHSFLNDHYQNVSGGMGWIGADLGLLIRMGNSFAVEPKIEGYFNSVDVSQPGTSGASDVNTLGNPAVALKFFPYQHDAMELGLTGQVGMPMISSDLPGVTLKRDGASFAFSGDMRLKKSVDIQLGYSYIPIKATSTVDVFGHSIAASPAAPGVVANISNPVVPTKTYNFGGVFLSVGYYF